jgi:hypothetical protein
MAPAKKDPVEEGSNPFDISEPAPKKTRTPKPSTVDEAVEAPAPEPDAVEASTEEPDEVSDTHVAPDIEAELRAEIERLNKALEAQSTAEKKPRGKKASTSISVTEVPQNYASENFYAEAVERNGLIVVNLSPKRWVGPPPMVIVSDRVEEVVELLRQFH